MIIKTLRKNNYNDVLLYPQFVEKGINIYLCLPVIANIIQPKLLLENILQGLFSFGMA